MLAILSAEPYSILTLSWKKSNSRKKLKTSFYAYRTGQSIIEKAESVSQHPRRGREVPEYEREDIREVFHHPYRIICLIKDGAGAIEILSVIHGSRLLSEELE